MMVLREETIFYITPRIFDISHFAPLETNISSSFLPRSWQVWMVARGGRWFGGKVEAWLFFFFFFFINGLALSFCLGYHYSCLLKHLVMSWRLCLLDMSCGGVIYDLFCVLIVRYSCLIHMSFWLKWLSNCA